MESISSNEADKHPLVKKIVDDLHPWPMTNEEAWYSVYKNVKHVANLERSVKHADRIVQMLIARHEATQRLISEITERDTRLHIILESIIKTLRGEE